MNGIDTDEMRADRVRALLEERRTYEVRGLPERVAAVDEQLALLGAQGSAPAVRAARRPRKPSHTRSA